MALPFELICELLDPFTTNMPIINLIHEQQLAVRKAERKTKAAMANFGGTLALGFLAWGVLWSQTEATRGQQADLQAQLNKMKPVLEAIEASEMQFNILSPRLTTLQDAAMATQRWARTLEHFSVHTPPGVWLSQLRCIQAAETEPVTVEIQGLAPNQEAVSEFILRLQSSEDLESVQLRYTQGALVDERSLIRFEISGNLVGTAKAPPPADEEGQEDAS